MAPPTLQVFSSGAVAPPLQQCAKQFTATRGIQFQFRIGKGEKLIAEIAQLKKGDVLTCGAEFLLDVAEVRGLLFGDTRRSLGARTSAILVQAGNPKKLTTIADLSSPGVKIGVSVGGCLLGVWDDVATKAGLTEPIRRNITDTVDGCGELIALLNVKRVDAVLGWDAFKRLAADAVDVVELPDALQVWRSTGVAVVKFAEHKALAQRFIEFLVSDEGKRVYEAYGWHHPA